MSQLTAPVPPPANTPGSMPTTPEQAAQFLAQFGAVKQRLLKELHKVIIGQDQVIELLLAAMFARGHCLLVGVPGLAKTLMISTLAKVLKLDFNRIQFTPDLMPADITGTDILEEDQATGKRAFRFVKGPVFSNIVLADEINRTPPKTQAALLQAMQEYQVTAGGRTYGLEPPFFVLATQNPVEQEGTYPLPEAQLDRFMFMVNIGYPSKKEERAIVRATTMEVDVTPEPVLSAADILHVQKVLRKLPVSDHVVDYAVSLARATRPQGARHAGVRQRAPDLGGRPPRGPVPGPGGQGPRHPGGPAERQLRRRPQDRQAGPAAPDLHQLQRRRRRRRAGPGGGQAAQRRAGGHRGAHAGVTAGSEAVARGGVRSPTSSHVGIVEDRRSRDRGRIRFPV